MNPESYLKKLGRESFGGRLVSAPNSELMKAINLMISEIFKAQGIIEEAPCPSYQPTVGPDDHLMGIRDQLIPFFPFQVRENLQQVPIGYLYDVDPNGYAAPVPGGGAVVCLNLVLNAMLNLVNGCLFVFPVERMQSSFHKLTKRIYAYGAAKGMHYVMAVLGQCLSPSPPRFEHSLADVASQLSFVTQVQFVFIIAHEYSHVSLGHLQKSAGSGTPEIAAQELAADESGAMVALRWMQHSELPKDKRTVELLLGGIGALFYAAEAILDVIELHQSIQREYPPAEDRFDRVIEAFRSEFGVGLVAADMFMRPYALTSHICGFMKDDPAEAVGWLSEVAMECQHMGDTLEELFVLSLARNMAIRARNRRVASQIQSYIEETAARERIPVIGLPQPPSK